MPMMYQPGSQSPVVADKSQVETLLGAGWTVEPAPEQSAALPDRSAPIKRKRLANASTAD